MPQPEVYSHPWSALQNLKTSQFQILGEMVLSKIKVLKKFRKNFSYVFPERTLYSLPLEAESNGRAVRA